MAGARKKVSQGGPEPPFGNNAEAENTRRQMKNMPFPVGGQMLTGRVPGAPGTLQLEHSMGRVPKFVLYGMNGLTYLCAIPTKTHITVHNGTATATDVSVYLW